MKRLNFVVKSKNASDKLRRGQFKLKMDTKEDFFSKDYVQARSRFLAALDSLQEKVDHSAYEVRSSQLPSLYLDVAHISATRGKKKLFILSSGVHGSEAPVGSALQLSFLKKIAPRLDFSNTGILLLHSINPYGFVTGRRVTENNIDLNRNFFNQPEKIKELKNHAYVKFASLLSEKRKVFYPFAESLKITLGLLLPTLMGKKQELTQAIAGGQYEDPKGIYYGGGALEPQVLWLDRLLKNILSGYEEVVHYDVHTGLGTSGVLQFICGVKTLPENPWVRKMFVEKFEQDDRMRVVTTSSKGFYQTEGDFVDFVHGCASEKSKIATFTAEFGTLGDDILSQLKTSIRIILENRAHHWGCVNSEVEAKIKKQFQELFSPSDLSWRKKMLSLGEKAIELVLDDSVQKNNSFEYSRVENF